MRAVVRLIQGEDIVFENADGTALAPGIITIINPDGDPIASFNVNTVVSVTIPDNDHPASKVQGVTLR